ncbi:DUF167 domain-containing protein [Nocardioides nematodiphilus]|uniref:DUF167 domain-containing protein n=1 Tax=Nocardioides nematodiphilus TaxID=2849669 RepID=UPI001CDA36FA|nr:DUF167 domain-containing protein [Nocardioides nematodiphilus]MCA1983002.1 DUF167 domain-containing protein [Nocardioides nematodiphilus]
MTRYAVTVKPGSKKGPLVETGDDGALTVFVRERAVDGAANDGVVTVLADHFGVPRSRVEILRGHTSRHKLVEVDD